MRRYYVKKNKIFVFYFKSPSIRRDRRPLKCRSPNVISQKHCIKSHKISHTVDSIIIAQGRGVGSPDTPR